MSSFKKQQYPRFGKNRCKIEKLDVRDWGLHLKVVVDCENPKSFYQNFGPKFDAEQAYETVKHIYAAILGKKVVDKIANGLSFDDFLREATDMLPDDYQTKELDVFLQWQWSFPTDKDGRQYTKTYLELPKKVAHGAFLHPSTSGYKMFWQWKPAKGMGTLPQNFGDDDVVLTYVNKDGEVHPFSRTGWFMKSNFGVRQGVELDQTERREQPKSREVEQSSMIDDDLPF